MQILRSVVFRRAALVMCSICATASAAAQVPADLQDVSGLPVVGDAATFVPPFQLIEHRRSGAEQPAFPQPVAKLPGLHLASSASRPASSTPRDRVLAVIRATELRHRIPAGLLDALVAIESNYRPFAVSRAGAAGLSQLMPGTARDLGVADRFDVHANLDGGARYLRAMLDQFGTVALALAAYNAGPNAVTRSRGIPLNGETPAYVVRVIARWRNLTSRGGGDDR